jgi:hyaluronan synthase
LNARAGSDAGKLELIVSGTHAGDVRQRLARVGWERAKRSAARQRPRRITALRADRVPLRMRATDVATRIGRPVRALRSFAIAPTLGWAERIDWPRSASRISAAAHSGAAALYAVAVWVVWITRSMAFALDRIGRAGWSRGSAATVRCVGAAWTIAGRSAMAIGRGGRAAQGALVRAGDAALWRASSAVVAFGRKASAKRTVVAAARVSLARTVANVAERSANTSVRFTRATGAASRRVTAAGWRAITLPPIVLGRLLATAGHATTATLARATNATLTVFERTATAGRSLVSLPGAAVDLIREDTSRAWARFFSFVIFAMCAANIFFLRWENFGYFWYRPFLNTYSIAVAAFILSRFVVALFYRQPLPRGLEPTVSIVITAFNEEDAVLRTIECCKQVDYPREKLEVVIVDDGSTDGTGEELDHAKRVWPDLRVVRFDVNRGKREAMAAGARIAHGEVLVYVDSDSFLRPDAVRQIVQGFADPSVAAVAGHTDVANRRQNALTRMQDVRYYVAFRLLKASESVFGAVTCCPGCFSAYRRECLLPILDRWLAQRFLGVRATFGDDRSLTNFLLRKYKVIYSSAAVATTIVPHEHRKFLRQQLRWKKSWLRECLIAATFMWRKHPIAAIGFYAQLVFPLLAPILLLRAFVWMPLVAGDPFSMVLYAYGVTLIGLIFSSYYLFWKVDGSWLYGVYFTVYYMFVLVWQMPYAIVTSRDNRWGTR